NESGFLYRNIDRSFNSFAPSTSINFNYNKVEAFEINSFLRANINQTLPGIDQLYPLVDSTSRYNIIAGNPDLKTSTRRGGTLHFNINRAKRNTKSSYSAGIRLNYN